MRFAIYWAPGRSDPLTALGNAWLGRDADTNAPVPQPEIPGIEEFTAAPRHYGFHCTLRPPMRLATSWNEFHAAATRIAAATRPFPLPPLQLRSIDGFLALTLSHPSPEMHALADLCVRESNPHRQAPSSEELARRRTAAITPLQEQLLQDYGYPYVMREWRFHITLTRRLSTTEQSPIMAHAARHFTPALSTSRAINEICIFAQRDRDFFIADRMAVKAH